MNFYDEAGPLCAHRGMITAAEVAEFIGADRSWNPADARKLKFDDCPNNCGARVFVSPFMERSSNALSQVRSAYFRRRIPSVQLIDHPSLI